MSETVELRQTLETAGYRLGLFASKESQETVLRLHSKVLQTKGLDVGELNDAELRRWLKEAHSPVGPVINHTRAIYQRRLLEVLAEETIDSHSDEDSTEEQVLVKKKNGLFIYAGIAMAMASVIFYFFL